MGELTSLSYEDANERARSADAFRRGLPILRAGGASLRASERAPGSVDPEVVNRAKPVR